MGKDVHVALSIKRGENQFQICAAIITFMNIQYSSYYGGNNSSTETCCEATILKTGENRESVCSCSLSRPLTDQSDCPIEAARAAGRSAGHKCRGEGAYPGHESPHSCAL